jgi:putative oxidoreductase
MISTNPLDRIQDPLALAGRILIAALFIPEGWDQVTDFQGTVGYIASQHVPLPELCAAISIFAHIGLPALLLAGWQARWAALALAVFVAVITPIFHNFWSLEGGPRAAQELNFWKNAAIVGGLLFAAAFGPGRWSVSRAR